MNTLTAAELKRRGMAAIEEGLRKGPLHLMKHNKPSAVVLTEEAFDELVKKEQVPERPTETALQWLLRQPSSTARSKSQIDKDLDRDRASWG